MKGLSVVVPLYNEKENIEALHAEIVAVCRTLNTWFEVIFVDDGSDDGTSHVAKRLSPLKYLRLRKNFGQTSALDAGIKVAQGSYVVTLDGDGQNDPADIPMLVRHLEDRHLDVVSGWRKRREDPLMKRLSSRAANIWRRFLINDGIHDSGCTLKVYRRECFDGVSLYGEMHRFIPALLKIKGFKIGEIAVSHRPRRHGRSKYGWKRGIKGFIDIISVWFWHKYAVRPLHLLGGLGLVSLAAGGLVSVTGVLLYFLRVRTFRNILPILAVFLLLSGIQLFVFGLIADMLSRDYFRTSGDHAYTIAEIRESPRTDGTVAAGNNRE